ncbi:MAG: hypothetical protein Q9198_011418, partial [Flavoplaca austrocitrina]
MNMGQPPVGQMTIQVMRSDPATTYNWKRGPTSLRSSMSIYSKDVTDKSQADAINQLLDQYVLPANKTDVYASECNRHSMWTLFWNAPLTESQAEILKQNPN